MPPIETAPASAQSSRISSTCAGESLMPGISGAIRTPVGMPARLSSATASIRLRGCGVCGSLARQAFSSRVGIERFAAKLRDLLEQLDVAQQQRRLGQHRAGRARVAHRLPDARHQLVASLDPLVRIGVGAERDVLALPRRAHQLRPGDLRRVDLDDDLALEVPAGVEVEIGVGGASEAVVADDAVGDEVPGAGGDVVERELDSERLDRPRHSSLALALDRGARDRALAGDRRVDRVEEAQHLARGRRAAGRTFTSVRWLRPRRRAENPSRRRQYWSSR